MDIFVVIEIIAPIILMILGLCRAISQETFGIAAVVCGFITIIIDELKKRGKI